MLAKKSLPVEVIQRSSTLVEEPPFKKHTLVEIAGEFAKEQNLIKPFGPGLIRKLKQLSLEFGVQGICWAEPLVVPLYGVNSRERESMG